MMSSNSIERFIVAAVRPLEDDAEMQMTAGVELASIMEAIEELPDKEALEQASAALENAPRSGKWRLLLYVACVVVSVFALIPVAWDYQRQRIANYGLYPTDDFRVPLPGPRMGPESIQKVPSILGDFSPEEHLLLFGDLVKSPRPEQFRALWDKEPDNAVYFAEYARALAERDGPLPPDFLATADRLDPGNAWYRHLAAAVAARKSTEISPPTKGRKVGPPPPSYVIKAPAQAADAIRLMEEASRLPNYDSHVDELLLERLRVLPPGNDILGRKLVRDYFEWVPPRQWFQGSIHRLVAAEGRRIAALGDAEQFLGLIRTWETLLRKPLESPDQTPSELPFSGLRDTFNELSIAAGHLGLSEEAKRFSRISSFLRYRRNVGAGTNNLDQEGSRAALRLVDLSRSVQDPPPLDSRELTPGRMAEYAMLRKYFSSAAMIFFVALALIAAASRFRFGEQPRQLSASLIHALHRKDHAWILVGGVLAPFLIHQVIEHSGPFGLYRLSLSETGFAECSRATALAGLMLTLSWIIAAKRFGRCLPMLGWRRKFLWPTFGCACCLLLWLVSWIPSFNGITPHADFFDCVLAFLGFVVAGTLAAIAIVCVPSRKEAVPHITFKRALTPAFVLSALLMALASLAYQESEKDWTRRDTLTKIDRSVPALTRYDHEIALLRRKELLEVLNTKP